MNLDDTVDIYTLPNQVATTLSTVAREDSFQYCLQVARVRLAPHIFGISQLMTFKLLLHLLIAYKEAMRHLMIDVSVSCGWVLLCCLWRSSVHIVSLVGSFIVTWYESQFTVED